MDILLVVLKVVTCFALSVNFMFCLGLEEFSLGSVAEDDGELVAAPRHTRSIRLCPHGMSGEQCFYSQLAMFVRQHNSFTDPVALRNIGKRSSITDVAAVDDDMDYFEPSFDEDYSNDILQLPAGADMSPTSFNKDNNKGLLDSDTLYDNRNFLGKLLKMPTILNALDDEKLIENINSRVKKDRSPFWPKSKRQIICPPGMPRVACYDDALAFYIQLMRTMNHKRFV